VIVEWKVEGLKELALALKALPEKMGQRALNAAAMAGAEIIRKAAANAAPMGDPDAPTLKLNIIKRKARKTSNNLNAEVHIAPRSKGSKNKDDPKNVYYWRFVEFGRPSQGVPADPFLRPAFDANKYKAVDAVKERLAKRIEVEATKLGRR
jgi:HK97 gp10 family phage protein